MANPKPIKAFGKTFASTSAVASHYEISEAALAARLRQGQKAENAIESLLPIVVHGQKFKTHVAVAKNFKIDEAILRHRVKNLGMSYEKALSLPVKKLKSGPVIVKDVEYPSFAAACKAYDKDPESTRHRLYAGMDAEAAILEPNKRSKPIDYLDMSFKSHAELVKYFDLIPETFYGRIRRGWDIAEAINKPAFYSYEIKYKNKIYVSLNNLCKELSLPYKLVYKRWRIFKWPLELAIETPKKQSGKSLEINGRKFSSQRAAATYYKIDPGLFRWRLSVGWPLEKVIDPNAEVDNRKPIEIDGQYFDNMSTAARAFYLNPVTFMKRVRVGWTHRQAAGLDEPPERDIGTPPVSPEEYKRRLYEVHGDNLNFEKAEFAKSQDKIEVICNVGNQHSSFWATPNNLLRGKGCPICKLSHGARKVAQWLDDHCIAYETEWTGHGLRSNSYEKATLRMDFYLPDQKTIIEFDGAQHFEPTTFGRMTEEQAILAYEQLSMNDVRKNQWAEDEGFKMLRIRYDQSVSDILEKAFAGLKI